MGLYYAIVMWLLWVLSAVVSYLGRSANLVLSTSIIGVVCFGVAFVFAKVSKASK